MEKPHVAIALTGASGALVGVKCLEFLRRHHTAVTHLTVTEAAKRVLHHELGYGAYDSLLSLADYYYDAFDVGACIASGSFPTAGMVIAPSTLNTAMALAAGLGTNLVERAGQVHLKEGRPLVVCLRESPLAPLHLTRLGQLAASGATVMPLSPRFYLFPDSVDRMVEDMALKALGPLGLNGLPERHYDPNSP